METKEEPSNHLLIPSSSAVAADSVTTTTNIHTLSPVSVTSNASITSSISDQVFIGDDFNEAPFPDRVSILVKAWSNATHKLGQNNLLKILHRTTLLLLLQEEWRKLDTELTSGLCSALEKCVTVLSKSGPSGSVVKKLKSLLCTAKDPWYHPVLKQLMAGVSPSKDEFICWLREEGYVGALERLRQLCTAGGSCCKAALILSESILDTDTFPVPPSVKKVAIDAYLVLLLRAGKTKECIGHIEKLDTKEAAGVIGRLSVRNKKNGRIWKHARDTALLCAQVLVAASLVRPLDVDDLGTLAAQLTALYSKSNNELPPTLRKLLQSAETAHHIYILCRAVQNEFGENMQQFVCELYIRALTTGINELERLKLQDETSESASTASHQLASWFLALGEYLSANPFVSAECVLTAFSLHPSRYYYRKVEDSSIVVNKSNKPPEDASKYVDDDPERIFALKTDEIKNNTHSTKDTVDLKACDNLAVPNLISGAVLEGENLKLGPDMCHDLAVLLSGPRLKLLTWDLPWSELSKNCLSYMADTNEGTKTITKELNYVHLDYTQWTPKNVEEHDIYYGIEKGYEHHLEIEEDDDDWEEYPYESDNYHSDDSFTTTKPSSHIKKEHTKKPPQSSNNILNSSIDTKKNDNSLKSMLTNKAKKNIGIVHWNNNKPFQSGNSQGVIKTSVTNHQKTNNSSPKSLPSFYRSQMEQYEAIRKKQLELALGSCNKKTDPFSYLTGVTSNLHSPQSDNLKNQSPKKDHVSFQYDIYGNPINNTSLSSVGQQKITSYSNYNPNMFKGGFNTNKLPCYSSNQQTINAANVKLENSILKRQEDNKFVPYRGNQSVPSNFSMKQENVSLLKLENQTVIRNKMPTSTSIVKSNPSVSPLFSHGYSVVRPNKTYQTIRGNQAKSKTNNKGLCQFTNIKINNPMGLKVDTAESLGIIKKENSMSDNKEIIRNRLINKQLQVVSATNKTPPQSTCPDFNVSNYSYKIVSTDKSSRQNSFPQSPRNVVENIPDSSFDKFIADLHVSVNAGSENATATNETKTSVLSYPRTDIVSPKPKNNQGQYSTLIIPQSNTTSTMTSHTYQPSHTAPQTYSRKYHSTAAKKPLTVENLGAHTKNQTRINRKTSSMAKTEAQMFVFEDIEQFGLKAHAIRVTNPTEKSDLSITPVQSNNTMQKTRQKHSISITKLPNKNYPKSGNNHYSTNVPPQTEIVQSKHPVYNQNSNYLTSSNKTDIQYQTPVIKCGNSQLQLPSYNQISLKLAETTYCPQSQYQMNKIETSPNKEWSRTEKTNVQYQTPVIKCANSQMQPSPYNESSVKTAETTYNPQPRYEMNKIETSPNKEWSRTEKTNVQYQTPVIKCANSQMQTSPYNPSFAKSAKTTDCPQPQYEMNKMETSTNKEWSRTENHSDQPITYDNPQPTSVLTSSSSTGFDYSKTAPIENIDRIYDFKSSEIIDAIINSEIKKLLEASAQKSDESSTKMDSPSKNVTGDFMNTPNLFALFGENAAPLENIIDGIKDGNIGDIVSSKTEDIDNQCSTIVFNNSHMIDPIHMQINTEHNSSTNVTNLDHNNLISDPVMCVASESFDFSGFNQNPVLDTDLFYKETETCPPLQNQSQIKSSISLKSPLLALLLKSTSDPSTLIECLHSDSSWKASESDNNDTINEIVTNTSTITTNNTENTEPADKLIESAIISDTFDQCSIPEIISSTVVSSNISSDATEQSILANAPTITTLEDVMNESSDLKTEDIAVVNAPSIATPEDVITEPSALKTEDITIINVPTITSSENVIGDIKTSKDINSNSPSSDLESNSSVDECPIKMNEDSNMVSSIEKSTVPEDQKSITENINSPEKNNSPKCDVTTTTELSDAVIEIDDQSEDTYKDVKKVTTRKSIGIKRNKNRKSVKISSKLSATSNSDDDSDAALSIIKDASKRKVFEKNKASKIPTNTLKTFEENEVTSIIPKFPAPVAPIKLDGAPACVINISDNSDDDVIEVPIEDPIAISEMDIKGASEEIPDRRKTPARKRKITSTIKEPMTIVVDDPISNKIIKAHDIGFSDQLKLQMVCRVEVHDINTDSCEVAKFQRSLYGIKQSHGARNQKTLKNIVLKENLNIVNRNTKKDTVFKKQLMKTMSNSKFRVKTPISTQPMRRFVRNQASHKEVENLNSLKDQNSTRFSERVTRSKIIHQNIKPLVKKPSRSFVKNKIGKSAKNKKYSVRIKTATEQRSKEIEELHAEKPQVFRSRNGNSPLLRNKQIFIRSSARISGKKIKERPNDSEPEIKIEIDENDDEDDKPLNSINRDTIQKNEATSQSSDVSSDVNLNTIAKSTEDEATDSLKTLEVHGESSDSDQAEVLVTDSLKTSSPCNKSSHDDKNTTVNLTKDESTCTLNASTSCNESSDIIENTTKNQTEGVATDSLKILLSSDECSDVIKNLADDVATDRLKTYRKKISKTKNTAVKLQFIENLIKDCDSSNIDLPNVSSEPINKPLEFPESQSAMSITRLLLNDDANHQDANYSKAEDFNFKTKGSITTLNTYDESLSAEDSLNEGITLFQTNFPHLDNDYREGGENNSNNTINNRDYFMDIKDFDMESDREKTEHIGNHVQISAASLSDYINVRLPIQNEHSTSKTHPEPFSLEIKAEKRFEKMHLVSIIQAEIENLLNNNAMKNDDKQVVLAELKNLKNDAKSEINEIETANSKKVMDIFAQVQKVCKKFQKENPSYSNIFCHIPGVSDSNHFVPPPSYPIIQVIQIGQMPVTSSQQCSTAAPTPSSEYSDTTTTTNNSEDSSSPNHDSKQESTDDDVKDNSSDEISDQAKSDNSNNKPSSEEEQSDAKPTDNNTVTSLIQNGDESTACNIAEGSLQLIFTPQSSSQMNLVSVNNSEASKESSVESGQDPTNFPSTSNSNSISANRAQTLMNILSQKMMNPSTSISNHPIQMATFPKGTPINTLALQQALAQILPPPLSQTSNDGNQTSAPQVVHIVQGKSVNQTTNAFGGLLVDNSQSSIINNGGQPTQVLHIVQGKNNNPNQSIIGQANVNNFSGLQIVESGSQQAANQVLHIVNTQNKNNATAQLLKRVNLLTSISNSQGNNEQKMVQFVCKAPDGKTIQLNTQPQRGMVLRLQPIDNSNNMQQKLNETVNQPTVSVVQNTVKKSQNEQTQQEIKSRSIYEENYAKFIQNSSNKIPPSSPDKSTSLPKFNQAFGKAVFQENTATVSKQAESTENSQLSNNESQSNPELVTTVNLNQINSPPLLIRKTQTVTNQNIQQVKQNITPMNIQTMHGGVIYTRQIPVNIGGNQTINLITVPSSDLLEDNNIQSVNKQGQDKINEQPMEQIIKIVPQESLTESTNEEIVQQFNEQNINNHPLLTQMRIKVPMLSKSGSQMVAGTRVVRPVLQIQRNVIPGTNSAVYQQLVLTTAPAVRQLGPGIQQQVKPAQSTNVSASQQESNLSTSTLEQLREFDMVLEQVKERSTVQPGANNATFSESPQPEHSETITPNSNSNTNSSILPNQREVLYSIGPNQTVNVTYVNQKILTNNPTMLATSFIQNSEINNISQSNSGSVQITHNISGQSKPGTLAANKVISKPLKTKPSKPPTMLPTAAAKANPIVPKTSIQKPLEDEQTTQRILYILAEYKEQVENSPDKDKPAPRRRSNPPTNPSSSSKRKKGSSGSKKTGNQSAHEMSPLGADESGFTMGSEDSSCGLSQGECGENSIQGLESQSPQGSPQKTTRKLLFSQADIDSSVPTSQPQQRNVIIADGQTITMTRPGTNKTTALLMPANYLLPMSMVKGGQQITIVTNQGPKILSVPNAEGNTTNTLFLQRLISPTELKPMMTRPNQVRQVRLPTNNMQTFSLTPNTNISTDGNWTGVENIIKINESETIDIKPDIKEEAESPNEIDSPQASSEIHTSDNKDIKTNIQCSPELKENNVNPTMNLIHFRSLSDDTGKIFAVQNTAALNSLIQMAAKNNIHGISTVNLQDIRKPEVKSQFDDQFSLQEGIISDDEIKLELQHEESSMKGSPTSNNEFVLSHSSQMQDSSTQNQSNNGPWSISTNANNATAISPSYGSYSNSPGMSHQVENQDPEMQEVIVNRKNNNENGNRILQHQYSPASSPGPRHLFNKIFISSSSANTSDLEEKELSQTRGNSTTHGESDISSIRPGTSASHSNASYRHKCAILEHELRLQKSLSEECEDLGVDSPSASDLFPEAELLFAASPSSQFEHSQDGTGIGSNQLLNATLTQPNQSSNAILFSHITKDSRLPEDRIGDMVEESEFARMHPNTTFHSGEIEFVGDDADDAAVNIPFRLTKPATHQLINVKKNEVIKSVIEGVGTSGTSRTFSNPKLITQYATLNPNIKRNVNIALALQTSDDNSESAEDSLTSLKIKNDNKTMKSSNLLKNNSSVANVSSGIIQKNITQVIRHASSTEGPATNEKSVKKHDDDVINQNGQNFGLETHTLQPANLTALKSDVHDRLACSSPEQHSELFWESNSNQSADSIPNQVRNLLDFSSEDSNKCCKSPASCDETNSTDSSIELHNIQGKDHNSRMSSVIKSGAISGAADGPILHSALTSSLPNQTNHDLPLKLSSNSGHRSDSNMSTSPESDVLQDHKESGRSNPCRVMSPRSLSSEIHLGVDMDNSSSEEIGSASKLDSESQVHSDSSIQEEGVRVGRIRRASLRGKGGVKKSCLCCSGVDAPNTSAPVNNQPSGVKRLRRKPPT